LVAERFNSPSSVVASSVVYPTISDDDDDEALQYLHHALDVRMEYCHQQQSNHNDDDDDDGEMNPYHDPLHSDRKHHRFTPI
jgi:hypothetical protein